MPDARGIIADVRDRRGLPSEAAAWFAAGLASGTVTDAQAGAFAMAVLLNGLSDQDRVGLTLAMRDSGQVLDWSLPGPVIDKHSTGGIGDCTSLLLAPALAACGAYVPMISGRGLGHTGGTLDKLEAIPGYRTDIPTEELNRLVGEVGCAIIGAGNVGCDAATEAHRLGAEDITLIDIQEPLSFGKEREEAERVGAKFLWPRFSKAVTDEGLELTTGEVLPADTVIISIGDMPELDFLPETVETERGYIKVDDAFRTSDPQVYAVGDAVKLGLLTDAIGMGRKAAQEMADVLEGKVTPKDLRKRFDYARVKVEYFDPRLLQFEDVQQCASQCSSCGACRDCGICATICPQAAITRVSKGEPEFEMVVNPDRCIGCGFCVGACPCGIWTLVENDPIG
jgi:ferredoxin